MKQLRLGIFTTGSYCGKLVPEIDKDDTTQDPRWLLGDSPWWSSRSFFPCLGKLEADSTIHYLSGEEGETREKAGVSPAARARGRGGRPADFISRSSLGSGSAGRAKHPADTARLVNLLRRFSFDRQTPGDSQIMPFCLCTCFSFCLEKSSSCSGGACCCWRTSQTPPPS